MEEMTSAKANKAGVFQEQKSHSSPQAENVKKCGWVELSGACGESRGQII